MQCAQTVIGQRCWRSDPVHAISLASRTCTSIWC